MFLKAALIAFTCSGFVLGFRIDDRVKRQASGAFGQIAGGLEANIPGEPQVPSTIASSDIENAPTSPGSADGSSNSPGPSGPAFIPKIPGLPGIPKIPGIPSVPGIPSGLNPVKGISEGIGKGIGDGISGVVKGFGSGITQIAGGVANRFQNAINKTYQEESNSVKDSFNSVKGLIHQNIETGANLTKTGFDLQTVGPKFFKNLVIN